MRAQSHHSWTFVDATSVVLSQMGVRNAKANRKQPREPGCCVLAHLDMSPPSFTLPAGSIKAHVWVTHIPALCTAHQSTRWDILPRLVSMLAYYNTAAAHTGIASLDDAHPLQPHLSKLHNE